MSSKMKSFAWNFFEKKGDIAVCKLCKRSMNYKNFGTSNLLKHIRCQHPVEFDKVKRDEEAASATAAAQPLQAMGSGTGLQQPTLTETISKMTKFPATSPRKQAIDELVLQLVTLDMQPLSIVEDTGFRELMHAIEPWYELPSRRTLTRMLPDLYDQRKAVLERLLLETGSVSLTTDIWTSRRTEAYLTVTAHFMTTSWELRSCVLDTPRITERHTASNIAEALAEVMENWRIRDKVFAIVTDNASNMVAAVDLLKIRHVPCFAHTLNLVVTDTLAAVEGFQATRKKVKDIVSFFHHSVKGSDTLKKTQEQAGMEPLKLINEVETRWNSCHDMLQRYVDVHPQVTTALCLLGRETMLVTQTEVEVIQHVITALQPFKEVTTEMSAEKQAAPRETETRVAETILHQLNRRFPLPEEKYLWAASTYLDPRFKSHAFVDTTALRSVQERVKGQLPPVTEEHQAEITPTLPSTSSSSSIWSKFDNKVASYLHTSASPSVRPHMEVRRYMEEDPIARYQDPLDWWKRHSTLMPQLQHIASKFLSCPATSVPSESLLYDRGTCVSQESQPLIREC